MRASRGRRKPSTDLPLEITDDALEVGLVEDRFLLGSAEEEGSAAEIVDLAGDALGVVVGECEEAIGENRVLTIGDAEMVFDVGGGLSEVEGLEMVADGDALAEGFVGGKAELVSQAGLAEEDESEQGSGIHLVVEQEAELVE